MLKYFEKGTASFPLGVPSAKRIFKVSSGTYAGRLLAIIHQYDSGSGNHYLYYAYADYPYDSWSALQEICTDLKDEPTDVVMNSDGDLYVAYTDSATSYLVFRKLTFSGGSWSAGSQIVIYNGSASNIPSIIIEESDRMHISWTRENGGQYYVHTKYSDDDGATWGSSAADAGDQISSGSSGAFSKMLIFGSDLYIIYAHGGSKISYRKRAISGSGWDAEADIVSASGLDEHFDAALSSDGRLGLVYDDGAIKFREFDSSQWSGIQTVDASGGAFPQIRYFNNIPYLVYLGEYGSGQYQMYYSSRPLTSFESPAVLDSSKNSFDKVLSYHASSGVYSDLTTAAANATAADIYHPTSSALVNVAGDALYLGMDSKFNYLKLILSTAGIGGTVQWQYFDGSDWAGFTPTGGAYHLSLTDKQLMLWDDYLNMASDWQKCTINGNNSFFLRILVTADFTTAPVGSQITAIPEATGIIIME